MLISSVDINIKLTRAPESFYLLAPSDDNKVRIIILDAIPFITQAELKSLFFQLMLMFRIWSVKHVILLHVHIL